MNSACGSLPGSLSINSQQILSFLLLEGFPRRHLLVYGIVGGRNITLGRLGLPKTHWNNSQGKGGERIPELRIS